MASSVARISLCVALLMSVAACGGNDGSQVVATPTIEAFTANPQALVRGDSSTLSWTVSGASLVVVTSGQDEIVTADGVDAGSGSVSIAPGETTTYTLTAVAVRDGQMSAAATATTTVTVTEPDPPTVSLTANPEAVASGDGATLTWVTTGAESLTLTAGDDEIDLGDEAVEAGTVTVTPTEDTTYTLIADGRGGTASDDATVTILPLPTVSVFVAEPPAIDLGGSTTLRWETEDASTVTLFADGAPLGDEQPRSGTLEVTPVQTTTYALQARGDGGETTTEVTVEVNRTVAATMTIEPGTIDFGGSAELSWTTVAAETIELFAEPGGVQDLSGRDILADSITVSPEVTTTYSFTAENADGGDMVTTVLTVNPPVAITSLTATPEMVFIGESTTVAWETQNAARVLLRYDDLELEVDAIGSREFVGLTQGTTYTIVAEGVGGPVEESVTVEVTQRPIPVIRSFTADPEVIAQGASSTLSWSVERAATVQLFADNLVDPRVEIPLTPDQYEMGTVEVTPFVTTAYELVAVNEHGEVTAAARVTMPAEVIELTASPDAIHPGDEVEVSWNLQGFYGIAIEVDGREVFGERLNPEDGGRGSFRFVGEPPVEILFRARSSELEDEFQRVLTVDGLGPQIREFGPLAPQVNREGLGTLNWLISPGLTDFALVGDPDVGPPVELDVDQGDWEDGGIDVTQRFTTRYQLSAFNDFGFTFGFATIEVPLQVFDFEAVPNPAIYGENVELRWSVQGAEGVEYVFGGGDPVVGFVGENGRGTGELLEVTAEGLVELTAFVGENGRVTSEVDLTVAAPTVELFTNTPEQGSQGDVFRLEWRNRGAAGIAIEAEDARGTYAVDVGGLDPNQDFLELPLVFETTFTLTATNPFGATQQTTVVGIIDSTPVILGFGADPPSVDPGDSAELAWETQGATRAEIAIYEDDTYRDVVQTIQIDGDDLDAGSLTIPDIQDFVYTELRVGSANNERTDARLVIGLNGPEGTLQVTEVFYNTGLDNPRLQWIELYNFAPFPVNLGNTTLGYGVGDWARNGQLLPPHEVGPFECIVIAGPDSVEANYRPVIDEPFLLAAPIPQARGGAAGLALFDVPPGDLAPGLAAYDGVVYGVEVQEGDNFNLQGQPLFDVFVDEAPVGHSLHRIVFGGFEVNGQGDDEPPVEELGADFIPPEFYVLDAPTPGRCFGLGPRGDDPNQDGQVFLGRRRGPELGGNQVGLRTYNLSARESSVFFSGQLADCVDDFRSGGLLCTVPPGTGRVDLTLRKEGQGEIIYPGWYEYEPVDFCSLHFPTTAFVGLLDTAPFYGRVYEQGVTDAPGDSGAFVVQWGHGPTDGDAALNPQAFTWFDARFNVQEGNDDEYQVDFLAETAGSFRHVFRVREQNGDIWTYCDANGTVNNNPELENFFDAEDSGTLEVGRPE